MTTPTDTRLHRAQRIMALLRAANYNGPHIGQLINDQCFAAAQELCALLQEAERDIASLTSELEDAMRDAPPLTGPGGF